MEGKNNNIITTILVVVLIGAAFYIGKLTTQVKQYEGGYPTDGVVDDYQEPTMEELAEITDADHIRGNRDAKIALIEYSDYECPFCQNFHATGKQVIEEYGDEVMWVYRHFPLDGIHPDARPAAIAAECVAKLGGNDAFWSFSDTLYDTGKFSKAAMTEEAKNLGVDEGQFTSCLDDSAMNDLVEEDLESGFKAGVNGTPGNFVLNLETGDIEVLAGAVPFTEVKSVIEGIK